METALHTRQWQNNREEDKNEELEVVREREREKERALITLMSNITVKGLLASRAAASPFSRTPQNSKPLIQVCFIYEKIN